MARSIQLDIDLHFSLAESDDGAHDEMSGSITAIGTDVVVELSDPARVARGRRFRFGPMRTWAARLHEQGLTVTLRGPDGVVATVGAVRASALQQVLTRSPHIRLGDRSQWLPVWRASRDASAGSSFPLPPTTLFPLVPAVSRRIRKKVTTTHAASGAGRPRLIFVLGSENYRGQPPREFNLLAGTTVIGSGSDVHLRLDGLEPAAAEIRHDSRDEYVLFLQGDREGRILRTGARIDVGDWKMAFFREEFADHGRPFGGRQGGELARQPRQDARKSDRKPSASR